MASEAATDPRCRGLGGMNPRTNVQHQQQDLGGEAAGDERCRKRPGCLGFARGAASDGSHGRQLDDAEIPLSVSTRPGADGPYLECSHVQVFNALLEAKLVHMARRGGFLVLEEPEAGLSFVTLVELANQLAELRDARCRPSSTPGPSRSTCVHRRRQAQQPPLS